MTRSGYLVDDKEHIAYVQGDIAAIVRIEYDVTHGPFPDPVEIYSDQISVRIRNAAAGAKLEIYNVLGLKVQSIKIDTANKTVALSLPKGCYILKLENIVRKIAIK